MTTAADAKQAEGQEPEGDEGARGDWKVVLQFFIVPLALVAVLVTVFFGLQILRSRHPDPHVRLADLRSSGGFLLPWVGDPKRWQSGYDLSLLLRSGEGGGAAPIHQELVNAFRESRQGGDLQLRRYLALALGRAADARGIPVLSEGLDDDDGTTRLYCAWGLMQAGGPSASAVLRTAAATHPDAGVRKMAVFALGQLGDREGASVMRQALEDQDEDVRSNAAIALARIGDPAGEPILIDILEKRAGREANETAAAGPEDVSPALNAIRGLALLQDNRARDALARAARTARAADIRETARLALESLGPSATGALP